MLRMVILVNTFRFQDADIIFIMVSLANDKLFLISGPIHNDFINVFRDNNSFFFFFFFFFSNKGVSM